ncbi:MAG: isoprenylcysteine carboxylmethyltransferase family protein [Melioribacteraceae bacterium]|nr:isoprenylcysteine carboxylmethyltransferase family protein [Melioribacteraceae bacterium]MCF8262979.1 isoprenylcysteine carboxylmethyltransferase family protein [Melioribacteraceae bacterium]MCF8430588.1 isoprenylcysteine carboxylmethyltransferase family protein [Melioribacteraceae bacterium]
MHSNKYIFIAIPIFFLEILTSQLVEDLEIYLLKIAGLCCFAFAVFLWLTALHSFLKFGGKKKNKIYYFTENLITRGIFSVIRHPQYLAFMFIGLGFLLINLHYLVTILFVCNVIFFYLQTLEEDKFLSEKFGNEYKLYKKAVPSINIVKGIFRKSAPKY